MICSCQIGLTLPSDLVAMVFDHPNQSQIEQYVNVKIQKDIADGRLSYLQTELKLVEERMKRIKARSAKYHREVIKAQDSLKQKDQHIKNLWKMILSYGCNQEKNGLSSKDKSKLKLEFVKWFPSESTHNENMADAINNLEDIKSTATNVKELSDNHQSLLITIEKAKKMFSIVEFPLSPIPGTSSNEPDDKVDLNTKEQVDEKLCPEIEAESNPKLKFKQSKKQKILLKAQPSFAAREKKDPGATLENKAEKSTNLPAQNLVKSVLNEESVPDNSKSVCIEEKVPTCIEDIISSIKSGSPLTKSKVDQNSLCANLARVDKLIKREASMAESKIDEDVQVNNYNLSITPTTQNSLVTNDSKLKPKSFRAQKKSSSQKRKNELMTHTSNPKKRKKVHKVQEFKKKNDASIASNDKTLVPSENAQEGDCESSGFGKTGSLECKINEENSSNCHLTPKTLTKKSKRMRALKLERISENNLECTDNPIEKFFETFKDNLCEDHLKNIVHSLVKLLLNQSSFPNKAVLLFYVFNYLRHSKCTPLTTFALSEDQSVLFPFVEKCIVIALFRIELKKITYLDGLLETAVTTLYNLILTKDFQMCGVASLCRVFTEICKRLEDSLKPVLLSAELLKTRRAFSSYLIASIASVWKELFYNNNTESVEQKLLHSSILYGACKKRSKLFEINWNSSMNIFSKFFNAPPVKDAKTAIHVLKEYIQAKCQNGTWKSDYIRASLTILAIHEDFSWVKENVVDTYILPNLDKFGKTTLNEAAFDLYCKLYVDIYCVKPQDGKYSFDNDLSNIYNSKEVWQGKFVKDCIALSLIRLNYLKNQSLPLDLNTWFKTNHQNPKVLENLDIFNRKLMLTSRKELLVEEIL